MANHCLFVRLPSLDAVIAADRQPEVIVRPEIGWGIVQEVHQHLDFIATGSVGEQVRRPRSSSLAGSVSWLRPAPMMVGIYLRKLGTKEEYLRGVVHPQERNDQATGCAIARCNRAAAEI
jgi:hypothetical protein